MGWFKRKNKAVDDDQIYDLKDVVWRGVDRMQRLDRLADDADRAEEHHNDHPDQPPYYPPQRPTSLMDEFIQASSPSDWAPPHHAATPEVETTPVDDAMIEGVSEASSATVTDKSKPDQISPDQVHSDKAKRDQAALDQVSLDMISDAVDAVVASDQVAASVRAEALKHDQDDTEEKEKDLPQPVADLAPLDVKNAVEQVVREEISGWLQSNMSRIIADSLPAKPEPAKAKKPSPRKAKAKTQAKTKAKPKSTKTKSVTQKRENIIPLKGRDQSS